MFNSKAYDGNLKNPDWYCSENQDPLLMILKEYDKIIGRLLKLDARLIICTGLHQKPHKHNTFYWRLKQHETFLTQKLNIKAIKKVTPRMSRDFLIEFNTKEDALTAQALLESYSSEKDDIKIFTIDNRELSLFVELTYPNDIDDDEFTIVGSGQNRIQNFKQDVAFVAIKNGEHHATGYYIDTNHKFDQQHLQPIALKEIFHKITESFK